MLTHDPRVSSDRNQKVDTSNIALVDAEIKIRAGGEVDWKTVASLADHCDNVAGSYDDKTKRPWLLRTLTRSKR